MVGFSVSYYYQGKRNLLKLKIVYFDEKHGIMKVHVDNEDDLWTLSLVIEKGDEVVARTMRDVSVGKESRRVPMTVKLRVERTEFQVFTNRLRILGVIEEAPEKFGVQGSHHTVNVDVGDELIIIKKIWSKFALSKIKRQAEPRVKVLIVLVDYDELLIAVPYSQGVKVLTDRTLRTPSKNDPSVIEENKAEILKEIEAYAKSYQIDAVIVAGPGPFKEEVAKELKGVKVYVDSVSSATRSGLNELLRREVMNKVMRDYEISSEARILDSALEHIAKGDGLAVYGVEEAMQAADLGAISDLLISEDLLITDNDELRNKVEELMNKVEEASGKTWIVPRESEIYHQLKSLTGVVGLLRFRIR
jgi:cell division protein pelota